MSARRRVHEVAERQEEGHSVRAGRRFPTVEVSGVWRITKTTISISGKKSTPRLSVRRHEGGSTTRRPRSAGCALAPRDSLSPGSMNCVGLLGVELAGRLRRRRPLPIRAVSASRWRRALLLTRRHMARCRDVPTGRSRVDRPSRLRHARGGIVAERPHAIGIERAKNSRPRCTVCGQRRRFDERQANRRDSVVPARLGRPITATGRRRAAASAASGAGRRTHTGGDAVLFDRPARAGRRRLALPAGPRSVEDAVCVAGAQRGTPSLTTRETAPPRW